MDNSDSRNLGHCLQLLVWSAPTLAIPDCLGRIFDAHADGLFNRCHLGQTCYASAFLLTLICATFALGFSLQLHLRQTRVQADVLVYID